MNLDLDKLGVLCATLRTPCGRTTGHGDSCVKGWECGACAEKVKSADIIEELVRRLRVLTAQAEALHKVGHALGLRAGADLTTDAAPAAQRHAAATTAAIAWWEDHKFDVTGDGTWNLYDTAPEFVSLAQAAQGADHG